MKISLISIVKDRMNHLKHSLKSFLNQTYDDYEVIIVCYGDQEAYHYCCDNSHPKLKIVNVTDNCEYFNPSRARNIGANLASGEILAFSDIDYVLPKDYLSRSMDLMGDNGMLNVKLISSDGKPWFCGACCVKSELLHYIRGFDESFLSYGYEDSDFYRRIWDETGTDTLTWIAPIGLISHEEWDSVKHFPEKNKDISKKENLHIRENRTTRINPFGYGVTDCLNVDPYYLLDKRYYFPEDKPIVKNNPGLRTWDESTVKNHVLPILNDETKLIVEVGSWVGWSADQFCKKAPNSKIICIDTWTGFAGYSSRIKGDFEDRVYDKFLANMWQWKNRIIPMRCHSGDGIRELGSLKLKPDLVYVDGDHDIEVFDDIDASCYFFPDSIICGDDYNWQEDKVKLAVEQACKKYNKTVEVKDDFWRLS